MAGARLAAGVCLLCLGADGPTAASPTPPVDPDAAQVRQALVLAKSDTCYLALDLREAELRLMLGGVTLRSFPYRDAAVGRPRVVFLPSRTLRDWPDRLWEDGALVPPPRRERIEIRPPTGGAEPEVPLPPLPDEGPPPPPRYLLQFSGGLEIEIVGDAGEGRTGMRERFRLLREPRRAHLRVRLNLTSLDADEFYRCLPPRISLVVLGRPVRGDLPRRESSTKVMTVLRSRAPENQFPAGTARAPLAPTRPAAFGRAPLCRDRSESRCPRPPIPHLCLLAGGSVSGRNGTPRRRRRPPASRVPHPRPTPAALCPWRSAGS